MEIWLPVLDYETTHEVSNLGRVRRLAYIAITSTGQRRRIRRKLLRPTKDSHGYFQVSIKGTLKAVHRLVADAFIGRKPKGITTCHNNGICTDNRIINLRYDTYKGNAADRKIHGTEIIGSKRHQAKLTEVTAREALKRALAGENKSKIARDFGVAPSTISVLASRKTWTHIHV